MNAVLLGLTLVLLVTPGAAAADPVVLKLEVRDGTLPRDQRVIRVRQGDEVHLRWSTNRALTVHLHGYDIERTLAPGTAAIMGFRAQATGRFPITVHGHGAAPETTLGYLEVHPR